MLKDYGETIVTRANMKTNTRPTAELREQMKESAKLDKLIWANLEGIGYGG